MEIDIKKINRLEIINHGENDNPIGRILTLHKLMGDFNALEFSIQDNEKTLKIFLG